MVPESPQAAATSLAPEVMKMIWGFMVSQALHVAAKLAVFDVLRDRSRTAGAADGAMRRR